MSTVPRRAGGTTFFRHVHLKAGIEVPRARFLYMNEERCARARPPGRTRARRAHTARPPRRVCRFAGDPCGACAHHSWTKVTSAEGHVITSRTRPQNPFYRVKPEPDQQIFLGQSRDVLGARPRNPNWL